MKMPESAVGAAKSFGWKTYSVSLRDKEPLLRFIVEALQMRGCNIISTSAPTRAPFYIVFETPAGRRHGLLAYAFFANTKPTLHRPDDEHRFQIKYGSGLKGILEVAVDPSALITTIFLGIDPVRGLFVAADPSMHNPSPMSRSIEFKSGTVDEILNKGWVAWERDRHLPKTSTRPAPIFNEDIRTEIIIGALKERLLDLIELEQITRGLDPGERHLIADKLLSAPSRTVSAASHKLLDELEITSDALFDLIQNAGRLKMAVRGWVAETHLEDFLKKVRGVTECRRIEAEGQPDITLRWKGSTPVLIECKNVLRKTNAAGKARVDFQRTRASKNDPCSRYYKSSDFAILAACLHPVRERWDFSFALTSDLPAHTKCPGRINNNILVAEPSFINQAEIILDKCTGRTP